MRHNKTKSFLQVIVLLLITSCSKKDSDTSFGKDYNDHRSRLGAPTIKEDMELEYPSFWTVDDYETREGAFHASKAIYSMDQHNGKDNWHETDVFRKHLNDTTYFQILLHPYYIDDTINWDVTKALYLQVDKRWLKAEGREKDKYPTYKNMEKYLTLDQVDSTLDSWGLNRKE